MLLLHGAEQLRMVCSYFGGWSQKFTLVQLLLVLSTLVVGCMGRGGGVIAADDIPTANGGKQVNIKTYYKALLTIENLNPLCQCNLVLPRAYVGMANAAFQTLADFLLLLIDFATHAIANL